MRFILLASFFIGATTAKPALRNTKEVQYHEKVSALEECQQYFTALDQDRSGTISLEDVEVVSNSLSEEKTTELMDAIAQMLYATGVTNIQDDFSLSRDDYLFFCAQADDGDMQDAAAKRAELKQQAATQKRAEMKKEAVMKKRAELQKQAALQNSNKRPQTVAKHSEMRAELKQHVAMEKRAELQKQAALQKRAQVKKHLEMRAELKEHAEMEQRAAIKKNQLALTLSSEQQLQASCRAACPEGEYCGSGGCRPNGSCATLNDCLIPENVFAAATCVGTMECNDGSCGMNCGSSEPTTLPAEAAKATKMEHKRSALKQKLAAIHAQNNNNKNNEQQLQTVSCYAECPEDQYCGSSGCADDGSCGTLDDCFHPDNVYPAFACIGEMECTNSTCTMNCGA